MKPVPELADKVAHLVGKVLRRKPEQISGLTLKKFVADRKLSELKLSLRDPIDRARLCVFAMCLYLTVYIAT